MKTIKSVFYKNKLFKRSLKIIQKLQFLNFKSYFVGGGVRDILCGYEPKDFDIITSAKPYEIESIFKNTLSIGIGKKYGIINIVINQIKYEIATFRIEKKYKDGRRPSTVIFTNNVKEDIKRRDFTINGILFDSCNGKIIDYVGGQQDIINCTIRTIGNPVKRFFEDYLRMLRAIRFASTLDFNIESVTLKAIKENSINLKKLSIERIRSELNKIFTNHNICKGLDLLHSTNILQNIFPEISVLFSKDQENNTYWNKTLLMLKVLIIKFYSKKFKQLDLKIVWAILFFNIERANQKSILKTKFFASKKIMQKLNFSKKVINQILSILNNQLILKKFKKITIVQSNQLFKDPNLYLYNQLYTTYLIIYNSKNLNQYELWFTKTKEKLKLKLFFYHFTGNDLIKMGLLPGPWFKKILFDIQEFQLRGFLLKKNEIKKFIFNKYCNFL